MDNHKGGIGRPDPTQPHSDQHKDIIMAPTKTTQTTADATIETGTTKPDVFAFPTFDPNEVTDMYRQYADQMTRQTKDAYGRMKSATEEAQSTMENTFESMQNAGVAFGLRAIDAMRTNAELGLSHLESLMKVKSASELVELQTGYVRKQTETVIDQSKAMQEMSTKMVEDVSAPVKEQFERTAREMKTAA